jgi:hypothetical protein
MSVSDTAADGHHVRMRLITKNHVGTIKYWAWHANYGGAGTEKWLDTYAKEDSGIFDAGIQIGRFEGDTILNACAKWTDPV